VRSSSRSARAPSGCFPTLAYAGSVALCCAAHTPFPPATAVRPSNGTDLEWLWRAEASSAKAAPTQGADVLGKAAPAPAAPLKQGQVAQPGRPAVRERPVYTPPSYYEEGCGDWQWLLFIFGTFWLLPSYIGVMLPLCARPRFSTRSAMCMPPLESLYAVKSSRYCSSTPVLFGAVLALSLLPNSASSAMVSPWLGSVFTAAGLVPEVCTPSLMRLCW